MPLLLYVHNAASYERGHIPGWRLEALAAQYDELLRDQLVVHSCAGGLP